jgi:hypothetical protein
VAVGGKIGTARSARRACAQTATFLVGFAGLLVLAATQV